MFQIIIQAGGLSTRMGQDKGLVDFLGKPLVQRVLERVSGVAEEVIIITNHPQAYQFLRLPLFTDRLPGRGALGGLYTALSIAQERNGEAVAIIACDLPFASASILKAALGLLLRENVDAVIPRSAHGIEPFQSVYRPAACLPAVKAALDAGLWRADSWLPACNIHYMDQEEIRRYDPRQLAFINTNTPADLQRAVEIARAEEGA